MGRRILRHEVKRAEAEIFSPATIVQSGAATIRKPHVNGVNQDRYIDDPVHRVYAVFDGVGGDEHGDEAAEAVARYVRTMTSARFLGARAIPRVLDLQNVMNQQRSILTGANQAIFDDTLARGSATTATLAEIVEAEERTFAIWSSIGDSRIYRHDIDTRKMRQLSNDEGSGNRIHKALTGYRNSMSTVVQSGIVELRHGDGLVLVTDGVTGDYGDDIMHPNELEYYYSEAVTATDAAKSLVAHARKIDDRTAVVVRVGE